MNTQEKKEVLVQAVEEIARKEAAYWEGNPKMQETFQNCYVSTAKTTTKFLESGEAYVFTGDIAAMWLRDSSAQVVHYLLAFVQHVPDRSRTCGLPLRSRG